MRCLANLVLVALCLRQDCSVHAFRIRARRKNAAKSHSRRSIASSTVLQYDNATVNAAVDAPSSWDLGDSFLNLLESWVSDAPKVVTFPVDAGCGKLVKCGEYTVDFAKSTKEVAQKTMELFTLMNQFWHSLSGMNTFLDEMSPRIDELVKALDKKKMTAGIYVASDVVFKLAEKQNKVAISLSKAKQANELVQEIVAKIRGARPPPPPPPSPPSAKLSEKLTKAINVGHRAEDVFSKVHKIVEKLGIVGLGSHFDDLSEQVAQLKQALDRLQRIVTDQEEMSTLKRLSLKVGLVISSFHGNASAHHPEISLTLDAYDALRRMLATSNKVYGWYKGWRLKWENLKANFEAQIMRIKQLFDSIGVQACEVFHAGAEALSSVEEALSFPTTCTSLSCGGRS